MFVDTLVVPDYETHFRETAKVIPVLSWLSRRDRSRAYFSRAWSLYTGQEHADADWGSCIHPEDRSAFADLHGGDLSDPVQRCEVRIRSRTGAYRWHKVTSSPIEGADGADAYLCVAADIEDEKQAIAARRVSENRLLLATDAAGVGVFEINPITGGVIWYEQTAKIFGVPFEQFDGLITTMRALIVDEDRGRVTDAVDRMIDRCQSAMRISYRICRPDGEIRDLVSQVRLVCDAAGVPTGVLGAVLDVTDTLANQKKLVDLKNRLQATYQGVGVGISEIDGGGAIVRVNETWAQITGVGQQEAIGSPFWENFSDVDRKEAQDHLRRLIDGETDTSQDWRRAINSRTGVPYCVNARMTAVRDADGRFRYAVRVINDVTEQQVVRDQEKVLLGELTHRVKNTVATIQSIAMQTISDEDDRRDRFVARLHTLSAVHALLIERRWIGVPFKDLIRTVLTQRSEAISQDWTLEGPVVLINPSAGVNLGLILHELASNAEQWGGLSEEGGRVLVRWQIEDGEEDDDESVRVIWTETGGPEAVAPTRDEWGFGFRLLNAFTRQLSGEFVPDFRADRVSFSIRIPTTTIMAMIGQGLMKL